MKLTAWNIEKTSRHIALILKIGSIFTALTTMLLFVLTVGIAASDAATQSEMAVSFGSIFGISLHVPQLFLLLITSILTWGVVFAMLINARSIFVALSKAHSPFQPLHVSRIKSTSYSVFAIALLNSFVNWLLYGSVGAHAWATWIAYIDFGSLLLGAIFYCLALVFAYGCSLQQQSDETL